MEMFNLSSLFFGILAYSEKFNSRFNKLRMLLNSFYEFVLAISLKKFNSCNADLNNLKFFLGKIF